MKTEPIISPPGRGPAPGPLPSWMCMDASLGRQTEAKPLQLAPFNAEDQWPYSKPLTDGLTSPLIPKEDATHPPEETPFSYLYPRSHSFGHVNFYHDFWTMLTSTGKTRDQLRICFKDAQHIIKHCHCDVHIVIVTSLDLRYPISKINNIKIRFIDKL